MERDRKEVGMGRREGREGRERAPGERKECSSFIQWFHSSGGLTHMLSSLPAACCVGRSPAPYL